MRVWWGAVAQLGERLVRNEEVSGSIPLSSTIEISDLRQKSGSNKKRNYSMGPIWVHYAAFSFFTRTRDATFSPASRFSSPIVCAYVANVISAVE